MLRLTLEQMRAAVGRLAAATIAIVLGTGFVAAALLASAAMERATHEAFTAHYADADLVLSNANGMTEEDLRAVRATPGVDAADGWDSSSIELVSTANIEYVDLGVVASDPRLDLATLSQGRMPTGTGEIAIRVDIAERFDLVLGDRVEGIRADSGSIDFSFTVVGLLEPAASPLLDSMPTAFVSEADWVANLTAQWGHDGIYSEIVVAASDDTQAVRDSLVTLLAATDTRVETVAEIAERLTVANTGSEVVFLVLMLGFASVSLAVAGLVIANTFQVLVAQRTRTLALLRCVGASRRQIRASVLTEALLLGLLASIGGLALGTAAVMGGVRVLAALAPEASFGTDVPFSIWVPVVTLAIGIGVTVASALVPARMATRVAPVAALRPLEGKPEARAGGNRAILALIGIGGGVGMMAIAVALVLGSNQDNLDAAMLGGLAIGVMGGMVSLVGLLLGSVFLVPVLLARLGRLFGTGVPARLAEGNAIRNPRRTAATMNALVIGVALVVMMSTGAHSARVSLNSELDESFPVDVMASSVDTESAIADAQVEALRGLDGVAASATARYDDAVAVSNDEYQIAVEVLAFADGDGEQVLRNATGYSQLGDDVLVMDAEAASGYFTAGSTVSVSIDRETELTVVLARTGGIAFITQETMQQIAPDLPVNMALLRIDDQADAEAVATAAQARITELTGTNLDLPVLNVGGGVIARQAYAQVIDMLLTLVLGLLGVAVIIALVGVANTLSLSVIERRRESATLRAIGLTRGQLRSMLAIEGVLISVVGAAIGMLAGLIYGWVGSAILLGGLDEVRLGVPLAQLIAVAVFAVAAGLIASVLPARSAVRQSPVTALATD
ncbi:MAG: ABC transporter permease [Beutenbergiaceae bacterium]